MNCTEKYIRGERCPIIQCVGSQLPKPGSASQVTGPIEVATRQVCTGDQIPQTVTEAPTAKEDATEDVTTNETVTKEAILEVMLQKKL